MAMRVCEASTKETDRWDQGLTSHLVSSLSLNTVCDILLCEVLHIGRRQDSFLMLLLGPSMCLCQDTECENVLPGVNLSDKGESQGVSSHTQESNSFQRGFSVPSSSNPGGAAVFPQTLDCRSNLPTQSSRLKRASSH